MNGIVVLLAFDIVPKLKGAAQISVSVAALTCLPFILPRLLPLVLDQNVTNCCRRGWRRGWESNPRRGFCRPLLCSWHGSFFSDLCLQRAATWRRNVEGAERVSIRVFPPLLSAVVSHQCPYFQWVTITLCEQIVLIASELVRPKLVDYRETRSDPKMELLPVCPHLPMHSMSSSRRRVTLRSPWAEKNQEGGHSKNDHDNRCDVGTIFLACRARALFKIVCS